MLKIENNEIYSTENKYIRLKNTTSYFKRCHINSTMSEEMFEELDILPTEETEEDYQYKKDIENKVRDLFFIKHIDKNINTFNLTVKEALSVKQYFPVWKINLQVNQGERYLCEDILYECIQSHTTQDNWKPGIETSSLWKIVEVEHEGTLSDPIPYNGNMELIKDKYYIQNNVIYLCTRNTDIPVYNNLDELINIYVQIV